MICRINKISDQILIMVCMQIAWHLNESYHALAAAKNLVSQALNDSNLIGNVRMTFGVPSEIFRKAVGEPKI